MSRTVLHVGPVASKGGMQATIHHHLQHPPTGWKTAAISTHVDGSPLAKILAWRKARKELHNRLNENPPDVVHIHTATSYSWWRKRRAVALVLKSGIPVVLQVHAGNFHTFLKSKPKSANQFRQLVDNPMVTAVALTERHRRLIGIPEMQVIGSPAPSANPVDPTKRDSHKLLMLSRPSPIKGQDIAIKAAVILAERGYDVSLHLTGLKQSELKQFSAVGDKALESTKIIGKGWVDEQEKQDLLQTSGLLLMPSLYEGMPVAAMEALACGLPVLASRACEGILGKAGRIVPNLEPATWADAIAAIFDDQQAWLTMCEAGPEAISEQTPDALGAKWAALYDSIIEVEK